MTKKRGWTPPYERILARLKVEYPEGLSWDECWPWPGSIGSHGYGQISYHGKPELVHRVMFDEVYGLIPEGHKVDHTCHNGDLTCPGGKQCLHRRCCNWFHLMAKSNSDNRDDADRPRGRGKFRTHCSALHPYTNENTMWVPIKGRKNLVRRCRRCNRENVRGMSAQDRLEASVAEFLSRGDRSFLEIAAGTPQEARVLEIMRITGHSILR